MASIEGENGKGVKQESERAKTGCGDTFLADFPGRWLFNSESMMTDTQELLTEYAGSGSESAFRELVRRYIDLVYSTAVRLVDGDTHRAEDIAQIVFADLTRMAVKLSPDTRLGGWLHRHTCFVARTMMRGERRRIARERAPWPNSQSGCSSAG